MRMNMAIKAGNEHPAIYGLIEAFILISDVRMNQLNPLFSVHGCPILIFAECTPNEIEYENE
jgi:hypothetical protein